MSTDKTAKEQQTKGRRKARTSVKTNDNGSGSKNDILHATSVKPVCTMGQKTTTGEDNEQDEEGAVLCSQKIVPTFSKAKRTKPAEKKVCQEENSIPNKRLKTTKQCKNKPNSTVNTTPTQNWNQSTSSEGSSTDDLISTGQCSRQQSDQPNTTEIHSATVPKDVKAETITSELETVTAHDQGVEGKTACDLPTAVQVGEQKLENNLTNNDILQVQANKTKDCSPDEEEDQQLSSMSDVNTEKINSNSGKQSGGINKEPHEICDEITGSTVIEGTTKEQEMCDKIGDKKPGSWKTTEPYVQLIDILKCKGFANQECISDGHSMILKKEDIVQDTNSGNIAQDIKTDSGKESESLLLTKKFEVCKTDQIKSGVPTLQVITATAVDMYRGRHGSSCVPIPQVINTEAKERDRGNLTCIPTQQGTEKSTYGDLGLKTSSATDKQEISATETNNIDLGTTETGMDTNIAPTLSLDRETTTDDTSDPRLDRDTLERGTKTDVQTKSTVDRVDTGEKSGVTSILTLDTGTTFDVTSIHALDTGTDTDVASNVTLDAGIESDVISNIISGVPTVEEDGEREEISDSQLFAITAMDWTEEPLGPAGDNKQSQQSETKVLPPSIPDGTAIIQGLIRELSNLNMMLLRAKREMQTSNQRNPPTRISNNRVNMRTEK